MPHFISYWPLQTGMRRSPYIERFINILRYWQTDPWDWSANLCFACKIVPHPPSFRESLSHMLWYRVAWWEYKTFAMLRTCTPLVSSLCVWSDSTDSPGCNLLLSRSWRVQKHVQYEPHNIYSLSSCILLMEFFEKGPCPITPSAPGDLPLHMTQRGGHPDPVGGFFQPC